MITECQELAFGILDDLDGAQFAAIQTFEDARKLSKQYLGDDQTPTIIDNTAEQIYLSTRKGRE